MFSPLLDEVEIKHQVHRGDHDDEQAEADPKPAALVDVGNLLPEKTKDKRNQINERDAARGRHDAHAEFSRGADQAGAIRQQQPEERAEGEADGLQDDAVELRLVVGGQSAEEQPLQRAVERGSERRPFLLEDGDQANHEAADGAARHPRRG